MSKAFIVLPVFLLLLATVSGKIQIDWKSEKTICAGLNGDSDNVISGNICNITDPMPESDEPLDYAVCIASLTESPCLDASFPIYVCCTCGYNNASNHTLTCGEDRNCILTDHESGKTAWYRNCTNDFATPVCRAMAIFYIFNTGDTYFDMVAFLTKHREFASLVPSVVDIYISQYGWWRYFWEDYKVGLLAWFPATSNEHKRNVIGVLGVITHIVGLGFTATFGVTFCCCRHPHKREDEKKAPPVSTGQPKTSATTTT